MIYKCKNCGGNIVYNPDKQALVCPHCDGVETQDEIPGNSTEICPNCGAPIKEKVEEYTSSLFCPNCGTSIILDERIAGDYKPELILPFKISREKAVELLKKEFGNRIFTPLSFLNNSSIKSIEGIYVPFFMYDFSTKGSYSGTATRVRTWSDANYNYTETSYYSIEREAEADYSNVPVDASFKMQDDYMDLSEPFSFDGMEEFQSKFMSGFLGEKYNESPDTLKPRAEVKVRRSMDSILSKSIVGYTTVNGSSNIYSTEKQHKYALLPVWKYVFRSKGTDYAFYVNGQTGKVIGKTPVDMGMVALYTLTLTGMVILAGEMLRLALAFL